MPSFDTDSATVRYAIVGFNAFFALLFGLMLVVGTFKGSIGPTDGFLLFVATMGTSIGLVGGLKEQVNLLAASIGFLLFELFIIIIFAFTGTATESPKGLYVFSGPIALLNAALYRYIVERDRVYERPLGTMPYATTI